MTYHIVVVGSQAYRRASTLPQGTELRSAARALIEWSARRVHAVVLRDGATGKRISVGEAMDLLGLGFVDRWDRSGWLARSA